MISTLERSIAVAEQYFSAERSTARRTALSRSSFPLTTNTMRMRVNTAGTASARSASSSTRQSVTAWRDLRRMVTTSKALHAPSPTRMALHGTRTDVAPSRRGRAVEHARHGRCRSRG